MADHTRTTSHVGISVADVEKAAEFYSEVMGGCLIMKPTVVTEEPETAGSFHFCVQDPNAEAWVEKISPLVAVEWMTGQPS